MISKPSIRINWKRFKQLGTRSSLIERNSSVVAYSNFICQDSDQCGACDSALASFRWGWRSSAREGQPAAIGLGNLGCPASRPCSDLYEDTAVRLKIEQNQLVGVPG